MEVHQQASICRLELPYLWQVTVIVNKPSCQGVVIFPVFCFFRLFLYISKLKFLNFL